MRPLLVLLPPGYRGNGAFFFLNVRTLSLRRLRRHFNLTDKKTAGGTGGGGIITFTSGMR
ncbi:hypothetical protein HMPREF0208_04662 [Citrobacter koseri]|nr:hypothetical protein HMPREF3207_03974 [Citrobacter koseri]KXB39834.1 hypothetical protein HMPREF0208_04662 [Citrobacter koseri]